MRARHLTIGFSEVSELLTELQGDRQMLLVGIDAPGSSGKTTFAKRLAAAIGDAQIVCMDDLQGTVPESKSARWATTGPATKWVWNRLEDEVIKPLLRGEQARYLAYDWITRSIGAEQRVTEPSGVVILEGLSSSRIELRHNYDYRIWIDCPFDIKRRRALARHANSRTAEVIDSWIEEERAYIETHRPHEFAHLIVSGTNQTATPDESFLGSPGPRAGEVRRVPSLGRAP